jgi:calcium binding protein 39
VPELLAQLAQETYSTDLLYHLVQHISRFDFESRKDVVQIFNNLLRRQIGSRWPTVEYISGKREVLFAALAGYENEDVALNTGMILREMLRHEPLCKILLYSEQFYKFPHYIETTTFGISTDAYTSLKDTLTRHKPMVAEYLDKNYDRVRPSWHVYGFTADGKRSSSTRTPLSSSRTTTSQNGSHLNSWARSS